ncbi:MAG: hypothetical protein JRJ31_21560 [Deltaproteobacteria bacterium]|nr:hypothetical protein [Deltaproteobacteria bacterium]
MKDNHNIRIVIRPVEGQEEEYQASYVSEFLQAEFYVTVKDSIFGALALQAFAEMILKPSAGTNEFEVSQEAGSLHSRPLLDVEEHAFCA